MKRNSVGKPFTILLVLISCVSAIVAGFTLPGSSGVRLWKGYYTLIALPADEKEDSQKFKERVFAEISKSGLEGLVAPSTEYVEYSDYQGLEVSTLSDLPKKLANEDVRRDSYMRELQSYFSIYPKSGVCFYVESSQSYRAFSDMVEKAIGGEGILWKMADTPSGYNPFPILCMIVFIAVFTIFSRGKRKLVLIAAVYPLILSISGETILLALSLFSFLFLFSLLEFMGSERKRSGLFVLLETRPGIPALLVPIVICLIFIPSAIMPTLCVLLSGLSLLWATSRIPGLVAISEVRRKFEYVQIRARTHIGLRGMHSFRGLPMASMSILCAILMHSLINSSASVLKENIPGDVRIPSPISKEDSQGVPKDNRLVDLESYLDHLYAQESFQVRRLGETIGEKSSSAPLTRYDEKKPGIVDSWTEYPVERNEAWRAGALSMSRLPPLEKMLLRQGMEMDFALISRASAVVVENGGIVDTALPIIMCFLLFAWVFDPRLNRGKKGISIGGLSIR